MCHILNVSWSTGLKSRSEFLLRPILNLCLSINIWQELFLPNHFRRMPLRRLGLQLCDTRGKDQRNTGNIPKARKWVLEKPVLGGNVKTSQSFLEQALPPMICSSQTYFNSWRIWRFLQCEEMFEEELVKCYSDCEGDFECFMDCNDKFYGNVMNCPCHSNCQG